ncbi:YqiA/YcfP family alpha/beta fold hydrolase [Marinospirillum insulare]|uniref:Alpha/beta hydrolase n=1 Tax=Marinospirillum insulare TaxID=217169 RepID=A0ABQ5ZVU8_9GAMM|nr:alpha/beta hydrolase [Marinospirillum insulare]GLR62791.1 hypothetical protein GCM10007878_02260 [Marinospirillum insulare]
MIQVYFSHGLESGPDGSKIQAMKEVVKGFANMNAQVLDYRGTRDPAERLKQLDARLEQDQVTDEHLILVGSSMGSWVSAQVVSQRPILGCFLLAPAFALPGYPNPRPQLQAQQAEVFHGWEDEVVPVEPVIQLCQEQQLRLHLLKDDHRLKASLPFILHQLQFFLERCQEKVT